MNALIQTPWLPRPADALMLTQLLRSSRLTLLFGQASAGKTGLLQHEVLPLLHQHQDMAVFFNASVDNALTALHEGIDQTLRVKPRIPRPSLADRLRWLRENKQVRLLILLDNFDTHLQAARENESSALFVYELKEAMSSPIPLAHFFMAVRDESQPLLAPWYAEVPGFGDRWVRIRHWHTLQRSSEAVQEADDDKTVLDTRFNQERANVLVQFQSYAKTQTTPIEQEPNAQPSRDDEVDLYLPLSLDAPPPAADSARLQNLWHEVVNRPALNALQSISQRPVAHATELLKPNQQPASEDAPMPAQTNTTKRGPWLDWLHRKRS